MFAFIRRHLLVYESIAGSGNVIPVMNIIEF